MKAEQFTPIVSRFRPRLLSLASQFDADTAEDTVQEALMRLWKAWPQLSGPADAERQAVRLTKYACIDDYRRRQRQQTVELKDVAATVATDAVDDATLQRALDEAVAALPSAERRLWTMHTEAQMDRPVIAQPSSENTGSGENTVSA